MDIQMLIAIASLITSIGTIAAVLIAKKAFHIAEKSFRADHERRKKQVTIEYYNNIFITATIPLRQELRKAFGENYYKHRILPDDEKWKENTVLYDRVITYCRSMERFAVGISIGVFDFDTFNRFSGKTTVMLFEQIQPIIEEKRKIMDYNAYCEEFQSLYLDLSRKQIPTRQDGSISNYP